MHPNPLKTTGRWGIAQPRSARLDALKPGISSGLFTLGGKSAECRRKLAFVRIVSPFRFRVISVLGMHHRKTQRAAIIAALLSFNDAARTWLSSSEPTCAVHGIRQQDGYGRSAVNRTDPVVSSAPACWLQVPSAQSGVAPLGNYRTPSALAGVLSTVNAWQIGFSSSWPFRWGWAFPVLR